MDAQGQQILNASVVQLILMLVGAHVRVKVNITIMQKLEVVKAVLDYASLVSIHQQYALHVKQQASIKLSMEIYAVAMISIMRTIENASHVSRYVATA